MKTISPRLVLPVVLVSALTACARQAVEYSPVETSTEIRVHQVALTHDVRFSAGQEQLSSPEAQRLQAFVIRDQVGYGDRVILPAPRSQAAQRQTDAVAAYLRRMGLTVLREQQPAPGAPANQVTVVVARAVVTPPNCPNWSKPSSFDPTNSPGANFGCATAHNFATMVADPNDLLVGRTPGPADGEQQAASINRYRSGRIVPLQATTSRTTGAPPGAEQGGTGGTPQGGAQ
jgi:pilus assembly protein CpaD